MVAYHLGGVDLREHFEGGVDPLAVQILSTQRTPVVSNDYPVWVKHWNNLKHKLIP